MLLALILWNRDNNKYVRPTADQLSANQFIPAPPEKKPEIKVEPKKETPKANSKYSVWSLTGVINQNRNSTPIP